MATVEAALAVLIGVVLAFVLAWLILSGLLGATFKRARTLIRRALERRHVPRPGASDRRAAERRRS